MFPTLQEGNIKASCQKSSLEPQLCYFYPISSADVTKQENYRPLLADQRESTKEMIGRMMSSMGLRIVSSKKAISNLGGVAMCQPGTDRFTNSPYRSTFRVNMMMRELSFDEWRLVASFLTRSDAFHSVANVSWTGRLAVLSCHFVQDAKCVESFVLRWMKIECSGFFRSENSLLPNERLRNLLQPLHDFNLFDLNQFVHPMEKMIHSSHEDQSLVPIPNYCSKTCFRFACFYGFHALLDQILEKPYLLPATTYSEREQYLKSAFSNNHNETAKKLITLYIRDMSEETPPLLSLPTIFGCCAESPKHGIVLDIYSFLKSELEKVRCYDEVKDFDVLCESIIDFVRLDHLSKLLKKKDFESALFILGKSLAIEHNTIPLSNNPLVKFHLFFENILSFYGDEEVMLWLLNTISHELSPYVDNPNSIISGIAHKFMFSSNTRLYCEYLQKYENRNVTKDKELVEQSLENLTSPASSFELFSLIVPSFDAFQQAMVQARRRRDKLFLIFEPWLSENYPEELASFLFNNLSLLEIGHSRYTDSENTRKQTLLHFQTQHALATHFLSQQKIHWDKFMFLMRNCVLLPEFLDLVLEKVRLDTELLNQLVDHIISTILQSSELVMMNEYLCDNEIGATCEHQYSDVYKIAAVLMYMGKLGINNLFQAIVEHKKEMIAKFPQVFPMAFNSITEMGKIENMNLMKDFQLVSHSTEVLIFISQHSILRKYLNLLASLWPKGTLAFSNMPSSMKYFFIENYRESNPDIFSVLHAAMLNEKDITDLINFLLSRDSIQLPYFNSIIHLDAFTIDHVIQIINHDLISHLTHIRDVCRIVDLIWNNFEQEQVKIKFREFFCDLQCSNARTDCFSVILKHHKKYMDMVEDILYDMLFCDTYYHTISEFMSRMASVCSSEAATIFMQLYGLKQLKFTPHFKLHDSTRLINILNHKINNLQVEGQTTKLEDWKYLVQRVTPTEAMCEVSTLLTKILPPTNTEKNQTTNLLMNESTVEKIQQPFDFSKNPFSNGSSNVPLNSFHEATSSPVRKRIRANRKK
ncbi:hypothetical protein C9374_002899 [Naegleria lovaniensis]|uniref:Uncharacterized protein n=1 Tax=Naegleria lovaniensis TaxID=51637 RepID=A0AA88KJL0_NAELO|nr:uncharacterized protein C9374_002899 [Naegleria lovaniensis]KAG2385750.1 hypothetical protein C9374_002899 [Naegleria lovaniensis]